MSRHRPTGRPWIGLALGLLTAMVWGTLPVILKIVVRWLDVYTITSFRFLVAGLLMLPVAVGGLRRLRDLRRGSVLLLLGGTLGLTGNYLTFMGGLSFVSPGTAQVVIQLSPMFMLLAGLLLFRESFRRHQWLGLAILVAGQVLFFQPRADRLVDDFDTEGVGVLLIVAAALLWGLYMVTQKQLLQVLRPGVILVVIYLGGSALLLPTARLDRIADLPALALGLLTASAVMTALSYFTFARALHHVEASRISVLVALTPVIVVVNVELLAVVAPGVLERESLPPLSVAGGLLVVAGSVLAGWRR